MPLAKIHALEGQYDEARLAQVSSAVHNGLVSTLGISLLDGRTVHTKSSEK